MLIVRFECVMMTNCEIFWNSLTIRLNRSLLASSSAASTSSSRQKGEGLDLNIANKQRDGRHGLFAAGKQRDAAGFFSRRLCDDFYAAFEDVFGVFENDIGLAAAEELAEKFLEIDANLLEGDAEFFAAFLVDAVDKLLELVFAGC